MGAGVGEYSPDALDGGICVVSRVYGEELKVEVGLARCQGKDICECSTPVCCLVVSIMIDKRSMGIGSGFGLSLPMAMVIPAVAEPMVSMVSSSTAEMIFSLIVHISF